MCACRIVVIFPTSITHAHKGPIFGIEDARTIFGFYDRPLFAPIVKSRVGLDPTGTAAVAEAEVRGGLDLNLVKDNETIKDVFRVGGERPVPRLPVRGMGCYKRISRVASAGVRPGSTGTWMATA